MNYQLRLAQKNIEQCKFNYQQAILNIHSGEVSSEEITAIQHYVSALELKLTFYKEMLGGDA